MLRSGLWRVHLQGAAAQLRQPGRPQGGPEPSGVGLPPPDGRFQIVRRVEPPAHRQVAAQARFCFAAAERSYLHSIVDGLQPQQGPICLLRREHGWTALRESIYCESDGSSHLMEHARGEVQSLARLQLDHERGCAPLCSLTGCRQAATFID